MESPGKHRQVRMKTFLFSTCLSTLLNKGLVEKREVSLRVLGKRGLCWGRKA